MDTVAIELLLLYPPGQLVCLKGTKKLLGDTVHAGVDRAGVAHVIVRPLDKMNSRVYRGVMYPASAIEPVSS